MPTTTRSSNPPVNGFVMNKTPSSEGMAVKEVKKEAKQSDVFVFDDIAYREVIFDNLNKLRKNNQFCDVTLQVGASQDVREIHAHRAVLASASPYLFDIFTAESKGTSNQYKFTGSFDYDAFESLVNYAYTGRLEIPAKLVKATYVAASKLRMASAAKQCGKYLVDNMTPDNCISLRSLAGIASNPDLLNKVDNYIRQKIANVIKSKDFLALPTIPVELLQNSLEEKNATNLKHLCDMVVDWVKMMIDDQNYRFEDLAQKVHMLYLNPDRTLHDCTDIENGDLQDSEVIQDYKKLSSKLSVQSTGKPRSKPASQTPAKPRQFLFTKSDSSSSLSSQSDEEDSDWKVIATTVNGENSLVGLVSGVGKLVVLSVVQRVHSPNHSPISSRNASVEKISTYSVVPPMSSARCSVGTAELEGKLLVCGGYDRGECLKTVESYDFNTNKWTTMQPMKVPRGRFNAAVVNNKVYAVGGCDGQKDLGSAEYWDPETNSWKQLPSLPAVRSHAGVCSMDKKLYVIGGWNGQRGLKRCDIFDTEACTWSSIAPLSIGRYQAGVGAMNGFVYAVGGCDTWNCLSSVERYDPSADTWVTVAPLHTARRGCGVAVFNGKLYAVGGHDGIHSLCTVEIYDPETDSWSAGPPLTTCRANVGVSVVGNRLFAVGGFTGKTFLNTVEYLDPENNEWTSFVPKDHGSCNSTAEKNGTSDCDSESNGMNGDSTAVKNGALNCELSSNGGVNGELHAEQEVH
ncbi:influenza virus NS1A-binding protein homolog isoform X1 [Argiope bruennichi]|uniref:Influenza virus NS1A-binding protein like protein n=2 Tax=Argiope bruennichi TaxID=94029 RepID=A0A8T0G1C1_ARGBR|nr:influenza virus NS1A-binding protein homolog isoform X1 [Argiope bruennichi]KAF8797157.1 Influenza virus NS1A-binding protein like protein [Argiope bruennichi]